MTKTIILGGGPAGLACGLKLAQNHQIVDIFEKDLNIGGISKTINYKNYLFDIGSHRFFTKSPEVNRLWHQNLGTDFKKVNRLTRIYYQNKFFPYPIKLLPTLRNLGFFESTKIILSYLHVKIKPISPEKNFASWTSNRFGKKLYLMFFKSYTEKVWGISCNQLSADWASQRIKGLSIYSTIKSALFPKNNQIKSLIDSFHYPRLGAGQMYDTLGQNIIKNHGQIHTNSNVTQIYRTHNKITQISLDNSSIYSADQFVSSIPITELITQLSPPAPKAILNHVQKLKYRSFLTINLILQTKNIFPDNWVYIHSPEVKVGRIQNLRNWSKSLTPNPKHTHLSLEYFCHENDSFWQKSDSDLLQLGLSELITLNFIPDKSNFIDGFIIRTPKAYPVYQGHYQTHLTAITKYLSRFTNLQLIGRYGQFKYNNMDHSILTGLCAANNILAGKVIHNPLNLNSDSDYQEEK